jgi:hypothetical protein
MTSIFARCLLAAILLTVGCRIAPALAGDRISTRIEVYGLLGLHVLTLRSTLEVSDDRYAITVDYATTGVAGLVIDQRAHAQVRGRLTPVSAEPESYRNDTRRNGVDIHKVIQYRPDGSVEGSATPPPPEPVASAAVRRTVDNLTAYFRLQRQVTATKTCALTVPVFDGRDRYDLAFADAGQATLSPEDGQQFEGAAVGCRITRYLRDNNPDDEEVEGAERGTIWYASLLPGGVAVPVRMHLETQIGTVDGFLAELHASGVDLRLME